MYHLFVVTNKYNSTIMPIKVQITFDAEFMESNFHCSFQLDNVSHFVILDFNECALITNFEANAQCTNVPEDFSFHCKCNSGYKGDGFAYVKIVTPKITTEPRETKAKVEKCKIWLFLAFYAAPDI